MFVLIRLNVICDCYYGIFLWLKNIVIEKFLLEENWIIIGEKKF